MDMDLVKRDDFDALRELVQAQGEEIKALKAELADTKSQARGVTCGSRSSRTFTATASRSRRCWRTSRSIGADTVAQPRRRRGGADGSRSARSTSSRALELPTVRGNHDRWIVERRKDRVDLFVGDLIREKDFAWLGALPPTLVVNNEVFLCHGTPVSDTDPWLDNWFDDRSMTLPDEETVTKLADGIDYPILLCGHTHVRAVGAAPRRASDRQSGERRAAVPLRLAGRALCADRAPRTPTGPWNCGSVPYDHEGAARQAEALGFGHWRETLTTGWPGPKGLFD